MKRILPLVFVLYKYFPFGGLQRDFLRIAQLCQSIGYPISVYTMSWEGEIPAGFDVKIYRPFAFSAVRRNIRFYEWVQSSLKDFSPSLVIGFNKMPGLDVYYAADTCYVDKAKTQRGKLYRYGGRYRHFYAWEKAVFSTDSKTEILLISEIQKEIFAKYYHTPNVRMHLLPPGISRDRKKAANAKIIRQTFRKQYGIEPDNKLLLLLGSGFITKGLDRALIALCALPKKLLNKTIFFIVGKDNPVAFLKQAKRLGVDQNIRFLPGTSDVPALLQAADALIHPAYNENTGTVLLEALAAGLPALCTDVCGYAHYIKEAQCGLITPSPFKQETLNLQLQEILTSEKRAQWVKNALKFSEEVDIYSMPEKAVAIIEVVLKRRSQSL